MSKQNKNLKNNSALGGTWEELKQEFLEKGYLTPAEAEANRIQVAIIGELIKARDEQGISQKQLEQLSGVKQPVISRMESLETNPQLDTLVKLLLPLGKTLTVVSIDNK